MTSARIVPGLPSGNVTTRNTTPSTRRKCWAANTNPNNGWAAAVTLTSHGKTDRRCCSLSGSHPEPGRPTWPPGWRSAACQAGHRVQFATASQWVDRLAEAHHAGRLQDELRRLVRYPVLVIDEVGYIPFEAEAANLFFQLVSSRYERASLIVTSNKNFARWGEVFGDDTVAAAMIDRLVHHADVLTLKGASYRLRGRGIDSLPSIRTTTDQTES